MSENRSELNIARAAGQRTVCFDYLRVFAAFGVMVLHTAAQYWGSIPVTSDTWLVFHCFNGAVRWVVPVFLMVSGALFVGRDVPMKKLYGKYIFRLVLAYCAWSAFYMLFTQGSPLRHLKIFVFGHYHMWFLPLLIGLYICQPFFHAIASDRRRLRYFLVLAILLAFLLPTVSNLMQDHLPGLGAQGGRYFVRLVERLNIHMVMGYAGYFALGYYLATEELSKKTRMILYFLGLAAAAATILLSRAESLAAGEPRETYFEGTNINILLQAAAVFVFFKYRRYDSPRWNGIMQKMGKYSFGAYLVHPFFQERLHHAGLDTLSFDSPVLAVITMSILLFVLSFPVSFVLNQIPFVKKNLV